MARARARPAIVIGVALGVLFGVVEVPSAARVAPSTASAALAGRPAPPASTPLGERLAQAATAQVGVTTAYESSYVRLDYPGGDVPIETGMCADVVIRAFRAIGVDLQQAIHEDMSTNLREYPQPFGPAPPDANIDHRRVNNLETYLARRGTRLPASPVGSDYLPGDVVTWRIAGLPHIGIVSTEPALCCMRYQIVHNIGRGVRVEDVLFQVEVTGHYRWR